MILKPTTIEKETGHEYACVIDELCAGYQLRVLIDEDGNLYWFDLQTETIEERNLRSIVLFFITNLENNEETRHVEELGQLRLFMLDTFNEIETTLEKRHFG